MTKTTSIYIAIPGVDGGTVRIDECNGHVGFGYRISGKAHTATASSVRAARRAAASHVRGTLARREAAIVKNADRMRDMRTIR